MSPLTDAHGQMIATGGDIASGGADGTVQIWNSKNGQRRFTIAAHTAGVNGLGLLWDTSNGGFLAGVVSASDDGTVQGWSLIEDYLFMTYRGHKGKVNAVTVLNTTSVLCASAGDDQTLQVWYGEGGATSSPMVHTRPRSEPWQPRQ